VQLEPLFGCSEYRKWTSRALERYLRPCILEVAIFQGLWRRREERIAVAETMMFLWPPLRLTPCLDWTLTAPPPIWKLLFAPKYQHHYSLHSSQFHLSFIFLSHFLFLSKVKQFHPDLTKHSHTTHSDAMIRRVIEAYRILSNCTPSQLIERYW